jgi:hypothetical protein
VATLLAGVAYAAGIQWGECAVPVGHLASVNGVAANDGGALPMATTQMTSVVATAHRGGGLTGDQAGADAELSVVQLWLWCDQNGNGASDEGDAAANPAGWTLLSETYTACGWNDQAQGVDAGTPSELLAAPVAAPVSPGKRYLLLLRVVAAATGYTSLEPTNGDGTQAGPEVWSATGDGAYGVTAKGGLSGVRDGAVWSFRVAAGGEVGPAFPTPPKVIENH